MSKHVTRFLVLCLALMLLISGPAEPLAGSKSKQVEEAAVEAGDCHEQALFAVRGLDTAQAVKLIAELRGLEGVAYVEPMIERKQMAVEFASAVTDPKAIKALMKKSGSHATLIQVKSVEPKPDGGSACGSCSHGGHGH